MHHPMTPIELIASALSIIATGALAWWGLSHLITWAVDLYAGMAEMRKQNKEGE